MRLIDADALEQSLGISEYDIYCKETIREAPTVENVAPIIHGKWIVKSDNTSYIKQLPRVWVECSHCHWTFTKDRRKDNYCSECGAKMEKCEDSEFYLVFTSDNVTP